MPPQGQRIVGWSSKMNTSKISRPFAHRFSTLLNGQVVSISIRARKVAIGLRAVELFDWHANA